MTSVFVIFYLAGRLWASILGFREKNRTGFKSAFINFNFWPLAIFFQAHFDLMYLKNDSIVVVLCNQTIGGGDVYQHQPTKQ